MNPENNCTFNYSNPVCYELEDWGGAYYDTHNTDKDLSPDYEWKSKSLDKKLSTLKDKGFLTQAEYDNLCVNMKLNKMGL